MAESGKGIDGGEDDGCSGGGGRAFTDHPELTQQIPKVLPCLLRDKKRIVKAQL